MLRIKKGRSGVMFVDGVWWMCVCDVLFEFVWMYFVYF